MGRLLLVDDDHECLTALGNRLRFAFRTINLSVDTADSASMGIILGHTHQYDAVIVDRLMPGVSGTAFVKQLRQTQPTVPVIMISGFEGKDCDEDPSDLEAVAFLSKPIEFSRLVEVLRPLLGSESYSPTERKRSAGWGYTHDKSRWTK